MGTVWSSYKLKRKEKAEVKRKLRRRLEEAEEYIDLLQEQHQLMKNLHAQHRIFPDSMPVTWRAYIDSRTVQMEAEIRDLRKKGFIGEVSLKTADERCASLEKHVRGLKHKEVDLQRETLRGQRRLSDLKRQQEARQFSQFQRDHPQHGPSISLPNLHSTEL
ncbi:hypothetical protein ACROYT_G021641 [Oculina patagonica]